MPVLPQYIPSVQAYYCLQFNASTDFRYKRSTIFITAPVPTNNSQSSDISDEYQYSAVFYPVLCQYKSSIDIRPSVLARYQASCKFPPGANASISRKIYIRSINMDVWVKEKLIEWDLNTKI